MKYLIACIAIFVVLAVGCYFWYEHSLVDERQAAVDAAEYARQWEINQKTQQKSSAAEIASPQAPAENNTAEKPITDTPQANETLNRETHTDRNVTPKNVRMSPHGFGPYPEVPEGAPIAMFDETMSAQQKLLCRVLVKLYNEGDPHKGGWISGRTGRVYPHYDDVIYVKYETQFNEITGQNETVIAQATSGPDNFSVVQAVASGDIPSGYTLIDMKDAGINPYEYLDLP
ncbi:MAG: hypothetical protein OXU23_02550 [Candidatus Poribacteria bacterium]|nr:hypothetical protein [Candidatus Poribacteria bacterium]